MDMHLDGKKAFVSGSTQGIGYAVAVALAAEGAEVVVNGRRQEGVDAAVARLRADVPGAVVLGLASDLADPSQADGLTEHLRDIDILVNNVGTFELKQFAEISDAEWERYFQVNVMSGVRLSRHALAGMLSRGWGRIIFVSSESGVNVPADMIHYGVAKAGVIALSNGLAKLTRGTAVTVNTILGGPTYSDGVATAVREIAAAQGMGVDDLKAAIMSENSTTLLERFIEPQEIARLAVYLASPASSATNGAAVRADGGVLTTAL